MTARLPDSAAVAGKMAVKTPATAVTVRGRDQPGKGPVMVDGTHVPTSVYRYYDRFGVLVYVGITSRRTARQSEHNSDKAWWQFVTQQEVEHFPDRPSAANRERELITAYRPPFNTIHNAEVEQQRAAYMAFVETGPAVGDLSDLIRGIDRKLPLVRIGNRTELGSLPIHANIADALDVEQRLQVSSRNGKRLTRVENARRVGPSWLFTLPRSIDFTTAYATLKFVHNVKPKRVRVVEIRLIESDEQAATRTGRRRPLTEEDEAK